MADRKSQNTKLSSVLSGVAGEYFVAAELTARGYIASITLRNTKGVDILCSNSDASKSVAIQVKTNRGSSRSWVLNQKGEDYFADNLFYVLVNLNDGKQAPDYFVVPSKIVATHIKESHQTWLNTPGREGRVHVDTTMRKFIDTEEQYLNRWDLLGL
jgi:hypothetical protein